MVLEKMEGLCGKNGTRNNYQATNYETKRKGIIHKKKECIDNEVLKMEQSMSPKLGKTEEDVFLMHLIFLSQIA